MKTQASVLMQSLIALKLAVVVAAIALSGCATTGASAAAEPLSDVSADVIDIYHGA